MNAILIAILTVVCAQMSQQEVLNKIAGQITTDSGITCTAPTIGAASNAGTLVYGSGCGTKFEIKWNSAGNVDFLFVLPPCCECDEI